MKTSLSWKKAELKKQNLLSESKNTHSGSKHYHVSRNLLISLPKTKAIAVLQSPTARRKRKHSNGWRCKQALPKNFNLHVSLLACGAHSLGCYVPVRSCRLSRIQDLVGDLIRHEATGGRCYSLRPVHPQPTGEDNLNSFNRGQAPLRTFWLKSEILLCGWLEFQAPSKDKCVCELTNSEKAFPYDKLGNLEGNAVKCNSDVTSQKVRILREFDRVYDIHSFSIPA